MASLGKRGKKGKYYVQYYVNGKQVRRNLDTTKLQKAKSDKSKVEVALLCEEDLPLPTKTPLHKFIEKYIFNLKARMKPENLAKVVSYLRGTFGVISESLEIKNSKIACKAVKRPASHGFKLIEVSSLEKLTTEQVSSFLASLVIYKGISTNTVNHYRQTLLTMCNWAMTEGGVRFPGGKNPVAVVKRYKVHKSDIRFLRINEITEQLQVLADNLMLQVMVAMYIFAGLRREEALWLMPSDFDWEAGHYGVLRVRDKELKGKAWVPKTNGNRTVPISSTLRRYLDKYLENYSPKIWFFTSPEGCRWDGDNFAADLRDVNMVSGLKWTCLDFRHTFGSHLASKGESLYKISKIMGNSPQICQKHYAHLMPESLLDTVEFADIAPPPAPEPVTPTPVTQSAPEVPNLSRLRLVVNNR